MAFLENVAVLLTANLQSPAWVDPMKSCLGDRFRSCLPVWCSRNVELDDNHRLPGERLWELLPGIRDRLREGFAATGAQARRRGSEVARGRASFPRGSEVARRRRSSAAGAGGQRWGREVGRRRGRSAVAERAFRWGNALGAGGASWELATMTAEGMPPLGSALGRIQSRRSSRRHRLLLGGQRVGEVAPVRMVTAGQSGWVWPWGRGGGWGTNGAGIDRAGELE